MDEPKTKRILSDRISSLPDSVIEHILACLPLREAAKTSVLSQAWKHKWVNRPTLAFNKSFWTRRFPYDSYTIDKLVSNVFKVICFHQGPLREFSLSNPYLRGYPAEVDQILLSLVGKCIQNLCIEIDGYKLSSRLFSFTKLQILRLSSCVFTSSHISFEQFTLLTHLHLMSVKFQNVDRVSLVIKCSLLQVFTLIHSGCSSSYDIDISIEAPNLNRLALVGSFRSLRVSHTPLLIDVSVHPIPSFLEHPNENQPNATDFIKLLDDCRELKELATTIHLIGGFVMSNRQPQQVPLNVLRKLTLYEMCPSNPHDVRLLAALLHLPPCLQELVINVS
ncbi:F-box/FBD/LRR-repeat protein At1g13570 [Linum grandiflorum]